MQQFRITKKIVGKGESYKADYKSKKDYFDFKESLKANRIIKEANYSRTREEAVNFIAKDKLKNPDSTWGGIFKDARITSLNGRPIRLFVAYKYRKY